ncbi:MAG: UDP-3-O-acyl-N-acetylglucosamine deacetylase [bacterium]
MGSIRKEAKISGIGLMSGENCDVHIFPSNKKGIRFFPPNTQTAIEAIVENVTSTQNCTVLAIESSQVRLVEHFMAACAICGLDSLDVCISNIELPILDGSAKKWVELFEEAGFESTKTEITIDKPLQFIQGDTVISLMPSDALSVTYLLDFNHPDLKQKWVSSNLQDVTEIQEARTFGYLKDLEKFQQMGLAKGVNPGNTLGLTDDCYTSALRSEYEPIKHKILDLIGDFKLAGINLQDLKATIIAKQAGHFSHVEMAKIIKKELDLIGERK